MRGEAPGTGMESRIKNRLASQPDAAALHFALGNNYAAGARWAEAQQAYFDAHRLDAQNPDYAYNLAISLDHLNQDRQALIYYERALTLGSLRASQFKPNEVRDRVQELQN